MRKMMWIYLVILFLSEAWSMESGTNASTTATTTSSLSEYRYEVFFNGTDGNLTCSDKMWNETFYVMWDIKLNNNKNCKIKFNSDGQNIDSCNDGKSLRNTSSAQPYLHIPKFSNDDVGIYKCEFVYRGGATICEINVTVAVLPEMIAWLEHKNNTTVAVCIAQRGHPAVNISWSHTGNFPVQTLTKIDGLVTVESRLELPEGIDLKNLSCIISRRNWNEVLFPEFQNRKVDVPWLWILIIVIIIVFVAGFLFFVVIKLRQQSDITPSKSPPLEDVEEVEPYASYVQRVNSIYN